MDHHGAGLPVPSRRRLLTTWIAVAALWVAGVGWVAMGWQREDPALPSIRVQAQRECRREQPLNLVPGETYEDCVERWIRVLWH